ncbi:alkylation response protein AidB-like acyl-CoA dehydrogenase [Litorivivens lipolytica]|uniref:Alkylation response protein AidB-like acyl-CoA dehydrogenase n=1 Tax=Litorivivens lipolytica TaxID=1524264 RepID=A0A7W4W6V9_9GAMM|nr:acyl-CoA dehydrogenase family protein [Litorivivens lipolytica]MBB3048014.1 alkylation response protein AidB-like acyl-CoA dehydrogenase [Litorivivens lipolytica]
MDFVFTEEQQMIRDTAESFLAEVSTSEAVRKAMASDTGFDEALWQQICAEMYWQAIHIPEEFGGMGLGYVELVAMMEQMGRYLLCAPFYSTVCLGVNTLLLAASDEQKAEYLAAICEGSLTATLAYCGARGGRTADAITATWREDGDGFVLNGDSSFVVDGMTAGLILVAARGEGSSGEEGISLFAVPVDSSGLERKAQPMLDQTRKMASLSFNNFKLSAASLLGESGKAWPVLDKVLDLASIALAAEQMGGSQQLLDSTVEYTKERVQFNRPIASFQSIKHKAADMMLRVEAARSAVYYAACVADEALQGGGLADELSEAASIAKAYCSDAYFKNAGESIQMHGGVGFTWEYDVHLYFKRAKGSEHMLGNAAFHRERLAGVILD